MDLGIVEDVKAALSKDAEAARVFSQVSGGNIITLDLKAVFTAARLKNPVAAAALKKAAQRLGIRVASIANLLNPEMIVIGGGFEEAGEEFLNETAAAIKAWAFREVTENLKIVYSQLRENAVALGTASLVMQRVFAHLL
jgi:glucokinase